MRLRTKLIAVIVPLALLVGTGTAVHYWQHYTGQPETRLLPLPPATLALDSTMGQDWLNSSDHHADYDALLPWFEPQQRLAWCGVASAVIALNTLANERAVASQEAFFSEAVKAVRHPLAVTFAGSTLQQLGDQLETYPVAVEVHHAEQGGLPEFRQTMRQNLRDPADVVLVNYQRRAIGQRSGGHISPLVAYYEITDQFLVMDVAAHKYPFVWVAAKDLWAAMRAEDPASGRSRGYVLLKNR